MYPTGTMPQPDSDVRPTPHPGTTAHQPGAIIEKGINPVCCPNVSNLFTSNPNTIFPIGKPTVLYGLSQIRGKQDWLYAQILNNWIHKV